jgi:hypothetical protein
MSDTALSSEPVKSRIKYDPVKDGPRMRIYMAAKRAKDKAGFKHLTVKQWLKTLEAK